MKIPLSRCVHHTFTAPVLYISFHAVPHVQFKNGLRSVCQRYYGGLITNSTIKPIFCVCVWTFYVWIKHNKSHAEAVINWSRLNWDTSESPEHIQQLTIKQIQLQPIFCKSYKMLEDFLKPKSPRPIEILSHRRSIGVGDGRGDSRITSAWFESANRSPPETSRFNGFSFNTGGLKPLKNNGTGFLHAATLLLVMSNKLLLSHSMLSWG